MKPLMDVQKLLKPIPGENPAGENVRYSGIYDEINEARRADDPLSQGEWQTELKIADWKLTIDLCNTALLEKSKDLQIAVWLTEALVKKNGYDGLRCGLELVQEMLEKYWDNLYPEIDEGDLDFRVGPMMYLNEKLPDSVYQVAVCDPKKTNGYSYYKWKESCAVGLGQGLDHEEKKKRQSMIEEGKITGEDFNNAVTSSAIGFYKEKMEILEQCRINLTLLDNTVNEKFAPNPPGFNQLSHCLDDCYHLINKFYSEKKKSEVLRDEDEGEDENDFSIDDSVEDEEIDNSIFDLSVLPSTGKKAISDISSQEQVLWGQALSFLKNDNLKSALDHLLTASTIAPSIRQKNRYLLLLAKLCLMADRPDLARPIAEQLYGMLETLQLEQWEHPVWIADVIETLYRCLENDEDDQVQRSKELLEKLCTLNITKAAAYRFR